MKDNSQQKNKLKEKKEVKKSQEEKLSWENVEKCLSENSTSGNAMAIIETEKIFSKVLARSKFPGKDVNQKILNLKTVISNYKELLRVRKIYNKLVESTSPGFDLENLDIRKILAIYYKAIEDINEFNQSSSFFKKIKIQLSNIYTYTKSNIKKIGITTLVFFFVIFLLDSTNIGNSIANLFITIAHFIFSWLLFTVLLVGGIIIIVVGSIFYFENRKKKKQLRVED